MNADGHVQSLRQQRIAKDLDQPKWWKRKDKAGGKGRQWVEVSNNQSGQFGEGVSDQRKPGVSANALPTSLSAVNPTHAANARRVDSSDDSAIIPNVRLPNAIGNQTEHPELRRRKLRSLRTIQSSLNAMRIPSGQHQPNHGIQSIGQERAWAQILHRPTCNAANGKMMYYPQT